MQRIMAFPPGKIFATNIFRLPGGRFTREPLPFSRPVNGTPVARPPHQSKVFEGKREGFGEGKGKLSEESFPFPSPNPTPSSSKTFDVIESLFTGFPEHEGKRLSLTHDEPPMRIFPVWRGKREGDPLTCRYEEEPFSRCGKRPPAVLFGGVSGSFTRLQGFRAPAIHSIHTP